MMMMMMMIYLTANGLLPGGSGYNACTWIWNKNLRNLSWEGYMRACSRCSNVICKELYTSYFGSKHVLFFYVNMRQKFYMCIFYILIFWVMILCNLLSSYQILEETFSFILTLGGRLRLCSCRIQPATNQLHQQAHRHLATSLHIGSLMNSQTHYWTQHACRY